MDTFLRQIALAAIGFVAFVIAPTQLNAAGPDKVDENAFFEQHIRPLLISRCYSCHSSASDSREGGLFLDTRAGWQSGGESGPALEPGNVDGSLLIRAVRYGDPDLQMPPDRSLSKHEIARLEQWVQRGAPDPRDESGRRSLGPAPSDPIAGREHWAFRPLRDSKPESVMAADWPRSMIDKYILARLESAGLRPAPDADRVTLARRLYIQLIGLPPTPDQLNQFLSDRRPDAVNRLVDRLLDSPSFGQRWGRHWLDLARYADSNGLDENFLFREAWRYRNQVIESFNQDTPFDRFLTEQIAGDLLPYESIEQRDRQRIAAGFLVIGPKVLLGNNSDERRMDVADEQIDTIGRAVLGQTLGCARCHDHKFDPVPTADYYALAGILTSTVVMEKRHMLGQQRLMEQLVGIGADGSTADDDYETYWRERPSLQKRVKQAKAALAVIEKQDVAGLQSLVKDQADSVAAGAMKKGNALKRKIAAQQKLIDQLNKKLASQPKIPPRAMIPSDQEQPADEHIRLAGQFDRLGKVVPRGFLRVLTESDLRIDDETSGRLELARWLTDTDRGAGNLAARVLANRIWHHLIGRGIVRTVDNFGRSGESPSHPELLDHLAIELIESGWSIKSLIRQIVTSRSFAISSRHEVSGHDIDPENRWLWRAHRRRLDPETLRDAMLSAAGTLDLSPMESSVWYLGDQATAVGANKNRRRTDFPCRSLYLPVIRNDLPEIFDVFDFADPHAATGMRPDTMVATQGLFLLNDESVMAAAEATAASVLAQVDGSVNQENRRLDAMFDRLLNARPDAQERSEFTAFMRDTVGRLKSEGESNAELKAWSIACQALFASSRFQMVE